MGVDPAAGEPITAHGHPTSIDLRGVVNATLYLTRSACHLPLAPHSVIFDSGDPSLAERVDELLRGFGED